MLTKVNVAECETQLLWERGKFHSATFDLTEALGGRVIGASVWETKAGFTQGPYHFHDGVEEWMYVVSGRPILRDSTGERALKAGTLVAFRVFSRHGAAKIQVSIAERSANIGADARAAGRKRALWHS